MSDEIKGWSSLDQQKGSDGDQVIYYRRPRKGENAGWITWADSISGSKLRDYVKRGFEPLMQFGVINTNGRDLRAFGNGRNSEPEGDMTKDKYLWEAILSHPDGPAEFPVDQLIAFRWYRPENCPVPEAYFPQLVGKKIKEYTCPEHCGRRPFVEIDGIGGASGLRQHLRIMHAWDQSNLQAYGERVGIDFNKADIDEMVIVDVNYAASQQSLACERCGEEFSGAMAKARLTKHVKNHPVADVVTV